MPTPWSIRRRPKAPDPVEDLEPMPERVAARLQEILHPPSARGGDGGSSDGPVREEEDAAAAAAADPAPSGDPPDDRSDDPSGDRVRSAIPATAEPAEPASAPDTAEATAPASAPDRPSGPRSDRTTGRRARTPVAAPPTPASCPYCATLLAPPPSSRRCPRCRQRIVIRHDGGRTVLLTEAAVAVFEAERRRAASHPRYVGPRDRWLRLATAAGAPEARVRRLGDGIATAASVEAARALYTAACDRAFRTARHDRHWERAERIRRDEATQIHRLAGRPAPPPAEAVALYREGVATRLRGLSEAISEVELTGSPCCDVCGADRGRMARIASEIRTPTLPHAGCPAGLCRCRWAVAAGDVAEVRRARRRARAAPSGRHA